MRVVHRRLGEKRFSTLEIGLGPLRPVARLVEPFNRPDGIAPLDPGIGENVGQAGIGAEQALEEHVDALATASWSSRCGGTAVATTGSETDFADPDAA
jgi:hypothetical protein